MLIIPHLKGEKLNYSEWCSINSYKGWLLHCNSYRLSQKYIAPIQTYSDDFYMKNICKKGYDNSDKLREG